MKKCGVALVLLLLIGAVATVDLAGAKDKVETTRLLTGKVTDHQDNPVPDAVVYLSNTRTRAVKTYIAGPDGVYRFPALSLNVDYEVYAQYHGHKSDTKTVSQFDDRTQVTVNLRVDTK
jgi:hypothetical protein